jgi:hypothetical protein
LELLGPSKPTSDGSHRSEEADATRKRFEKNTMTWLLAKADIHVCCSLMVRFELAMKKPALMTFFAPGLNLINEK